MIPGLEKAEFVRYGVMHRNTFLNSPRLLEATTQMKKNSRLLVAGQLSGVEGYVESAASGLVAGINASRLIKGREALIPPRETAVGSLLHYITHVQSSGFQPMNITFGLMPPLEETPDNHKMRVKDKKQKKLRYVQRALEALAAWDHT